MALKPQPVRLRYLRTATRKRFIAFSRGMLSWAIALLLATPLTAQPAIQSANLGQQLYKSGQYTQAANVLQTTLEQAETAGEIQLQAATLGNLALVYQAQGQSLAAEEAIVQALRLTGYSDPHQPLETRDRPQDPSLQNPSFKQLLGQLLNIQAQLQLNQGQPDAALATWQQSEKAYQLAQDANGILESRLAQAQTLQRLGFYQRALKQLLSLSADLDSQPDSAQKIRQLRLVGEAFQLTGDTAAGQKRLEQGLALAQQLSLPDENSGILLSLGHGARAEQDYQRAQTYYQDAAIAALTPQARLQALVSQFSLAAEITTASGAISEADIAKNVLKPQRQHPVAQALIPGIQAAIQAIPASPDLFHTKLQFAQSLMKFSQQQEEAYEVLASIEQQARQWGDRRSQSYALGYLGQLYQQSNQPKDALMVTRQALALAQGLNAPEVSYHWYRQQGQLLAAQGDQAGAIAAYDAAVANLQTLRSDLTTVNRDLQFSFREGVEPIYRESVAILLSGEEVSEANLDKARQRIESLQVAELDNYFREACIDAQGVSLDRVVDQENPEAAVLYPIVLKDKLEVVVKVPQQPLQRYRIDKSQKEVEAIATQLQKALRSPIGTRKAQRLSQELYNWLVQPLESSLRQHHVNTLVFVLDGPLRSVPMAALYDGEQYLVEKYAVSISLGLQLLDPQPIQAERLGVLSAGLAEPPANFPQFSSLPEVPSELALIDETVPQSKQLLNQAFTREQFQQDVSNAAFNVVHLATHGQFSSEADQTFVLAADGPINVNQFDDLLRDRELRQPNPIELLVLSACQTAAGDERATLGLAGVAVRAGARSTLASLWNIGDRSTAILIGEFYRELANANLTKAEALRRAQVTLLRDYPSYGRPMFWAPYVLVGNWL